jgi:hypothetical protein
MLPLTTCTALAVLAVLGKLVTPFRLLRRTKKWMFAPLNV